MRKKSKTNLFLLMGLIAVIVLLYTTGEYYYRGLMGGTAEEIQDKEVYKYKFDMIVDSPNSPFWQEVYESAAECAGENDVLLEIKGIGWEINYDKIDFMNMSIASRADGIILQYNGEAGLEEKIDEAVSKGIPVVTVMSDAGRSKRQSFIGVSDYQLGAAYGEQVAEYVDENTDSILILMKRNIDDMNRSQIYTQILNAVQEKESVPKGIQVRVQNLLSAGNFETEEAVTDIFQQPEGAPDILVCMDEETTECARQAVIDFNLAGQVKIIGYYVSNDILTAVEKGVISVTCDVDTSQLGMYSVEALTEYLKEGHANSYYNVDLSFIGKKDVLRIRRGAYANEANKVE